MSRPTTPGGVLLAMLVAACNVAGPAAPVATVSPLRIPSLPPAEPPKQLALEDQMLPQVEDVKHDPFLTAAEEDAILHGTEVKEDLKPVEPPPVVKIKKAQPLIPVLESVELELQTLFAGRDGKRHAVAKNRKTGEDLQLDEGQQFGSYVITSISDDAIHLKQKDGPVTRTIPFKRAAEQDIWKIKGK